MAPAFSKEAILQGSIDHLCLVCESYLKSERDVCLHVSTPAHRQNLDSTDYVEKYRNDRVRKVKKWYYCEFCNVLVSTIFAVGLHVKEPRHTANRSSQIITRVGDVIVSGNIAISEEAWHGFIDKNTCAICDVEYEDQDVHKNESTHLINLIQSKVSDGTFYRQIDDSTFHCLTCNEVVAEITAHLDETKHKQVLQQNIKRTSSKSKEEKYIKNHNKQNIKPDTESVKDNKKESSDLLDSIQKFQKNNININFETSTAACRRCSRNLEFNCKEIENHIDEHKNNAQKETTDPNTVLFERNKNNKTEKDINNKNIETESMQTMKQNGGENAIKKMAEEHGLTYTATGNKLYCQRCNKNIPSSVENITGHVNGELHRCRKPPKINTKKCNHLRVPFTMFIRNGHRIKSTLTEDVVVNDKYCIDVLSFYFLTIISPGRVRCQVCEVNLPFQDISDHLDVERHERAMNEVPVLIRTDLELIREIRSELFQCGYCNIYDTWEGMENHLKSTDHKETKTFADWRLSRHLPIIAQRQLEREIHEKFLMHLLLS